MVIAFFYCLFGVLKVHVMHLYDFEGGHLIMQDEEIKTKILRMWKQRDDFSWIFIETGEIHNEFQRKGIIQDILDRQQIGDFHNCDDLYKEFGCNNNRKMANKNSKKPPVEDSCIPWKVSVRNTNRFIKLYRNEVSQLVEDEVLDAYEQAFLFVILPHIEFKTNCVIVDGEYPTLEYMAQKTKLSLRKIKQVVKSLEDKNLVKRYKDGIHKKIFVNPNYFCAGSIIEGEVPSYFMSVEETTKELFNK